MAPVPSAAPSMAPVPSPTPAPLPYITISSLYYETLEVFDTTYSFTYIANWLTLVCYGWFSILIGLDVWRAITKRAIWLPGKAFSLTGVTVQIIVWWTSVSRINNECKKEIVLDELIVYHQIVVSGKVALCVFIGYLLPGMGVPSVRTFVALGVSICVQLASELIIVYTHSLDDLFYKHYPDILKRKINYEGYNKIFKSFECLIWMKIANPVLFTCIIVLGLILVCTILTSKTIHGLVRQRISALLSITKEDDSNERTASISWNDFEDEVVSSWFIARLCQADYVISRSVFSSAVGIVVTFCVIIFILSNTLYNMYFSGSYNPMDYAILSLLFSFIMIGWIVICWRWLASQLYFRSHRQSWKRCLYMEDFWTRTTVELIDIYDLKGDRQRFQDDESSTLKMTKLDKLQRLPTKIFTKVKLHKLLYLVLILQVSVVFFSKLCGVLLEVTIGNFVYWFQKHTRKGHPVASPEKYERILEIACLPGEDPSDLWGANKMAFNKAKLRILEGYEKGRSSEEINSTFRLYSEQLVEDGTNLLSVLQKSAFPSVLKHFPSVEKRYVKITAVSLITILIRLHKAKSDRLRKVLKACREVWDLLSFADECDIDLQANEISFFNDLNKDKNQVCMAAEREFYKLQMEYNKLSSSCEDCFIDVEEARRILQNLSDKCEGLLKSENLLGDKEKEKVAACLSDSKNWVKLAPSYTLYKLCRLMLSEDIEDFVAWTEDALRNVIACCLSRLPDMIVKQCWKWAQEFEENKLWEAIDLAGKCKGMMEEWEPIPKLTRNTTTQEIIQGV